MVSHLDLKGFILGVLIPRYHLCQIYLTGAVDGGSTSVELGAKRGHQCED